MIIKSPRAYNTSSQLVLLVLADCEMLGIFLFQFCEHEIHRILKFFIIFPDFHGVQHLNEGREALLFNRSFVMDVADQCSVQQGFCFHPEVVTSLAFTLGVGDQGRDQLQNVLFAVDVSEGIVVHGFFEVDGIEDFQLILKPKEHFAALGNDAAFGVGHDEADRVFLGSALHEVGFQPEAGFLLLLAGGFLSTPPGFSPICIGVLIHTRHSISFCPAVAGQPAARTLGAFIGSVGSSPMRCVWLFRAAFHSDRDCKTFSVSSALFTQLTVGLG